MKDDPGVEKVREARRKISAQFGHDPLKMIEHLRQLEQRHPERIYKEPSPAGPVGGTK